LRNRLPLKLQIEIRFCQIWFRTLRDDCSHRVICVTSLNMRKWMRERMQRRKKKAEEQVATPAAPPLQPAYFEDAPSQEPESHASEQASSAASEPEIEVQPAAEESSAGETATQPAREGARRGRRRRGGRGRGGRGREKAVAQAFAPAAGKGIIPDKAADEEPSDAAADAEAPEAEASEPELSAAEPAAAIPTAIPTAPARPPKGLVVLAIGLPGSGKSSWFKRHNIVPLSTDMLRSLLFDDVREQRFQDLVFSNLRSMLKARLIAKRPMNYVDATNLTPQERQHWIKLARDYNYEVHAVFFDVPLEVCLDRHQRRDRVVPEDVMRRMAAKLKPPSFDEGFAKITVVRVKKPAA
jgi:predicted kinase